MTSSIYRNKKGLASVVDKEMSSGIRKRPEFWDMNPLTAVLLLFL